mmetsp:Transcript_9391/g.14438  ORF Transcript_9391/g.14438 Transcript_9391/m.14438 type:complete len:99 (-) Transcript_9391:88-384(-)
MMYQWMVHGGARTSHCMYFCIKVLSYILSESEHSIGDVIVVVYNVSCRGDGWMMDSDANFETLRSRNRRSRLCTAYVQKTFTPETFENFIPSTSNGKW